MAAGATNVDSGQALPVTLTSTSHSFELSHSSLNVVGVALILWTLPPLRRRQILTPG